MHRRVRHGAQVLAPERRGNDLSGANGLGQPVVGDLVGLRPRPCPEPLDRLALDRGADHCEQRH